MRPNDTHYFKNIKSQEYEHLDLYATPHVFKNICDLINPDMYEAFCNTTQMFILNIDEEQVRHYNEQLRNLYSIQLTESSSFINTAYIPCLASYISLFAQKYFFNQSEPSKFINSLLTKMNTIEYTCGSLGDIITSSGYSHGHLCKLFKEHTGKTLKAYHMELKINYAIELLQNKKLSILDIASMLGYSSLSNFTHLFKNFTTYTPSAYRKQLLHLKKSSLNL